MTVMSVKLRSLPETGAAVGWGGSHSVIVDRPLDKAGGTGLGFNGGQLLALAIGGCLCNDLHYVAHEMGISLSQLAVDVEVSFDGRPLVATAAEVRIAVEADDPAADLDELVRRAKAASTVSNSLARGIPVNVKGPGLALSLT
ncbi:OsmC family protein [Microvirga terricola]|uniref:OsmC family protein n=1 Tax=Microvirga terricola TaxID=2719797 RepID=A0ABX0VC78_9HYPH|nr:OsmC family protein [Microvirga terricola]NIX77462.1 OsmC family protein [Microvirga terricola]